VTWVDIEGGHPTVRTSLALGRELPWLTPNW